jgi:fluoride exporter
MDGPRGSLRVNARIDLKSRKKSMTKWLLIAAGGGFGSVVRYAVHSWVQRATSSNFPWGTLAVNVIGCALIGFLTATFAGPRPIREEYRLAILVGVLGGFTTFSAFGWETFSLASDRQFAYAALNIILSCGVGLFAVWAGFKTAEAVFGI